MGTCLSDEAVANKNHKERIDYLQKQIKTLRRKQGVAMVIILVGMGFILSLFKYHSIDERGMSGLNFTIEVSFTLLGVGVGLVVLGLYMYGHYKHQLEPLEKEFATIATPEDWLRKKP